MKGLFGGIALIILVGVAGFLYRNATEHPLQPIACPLDAIVCPDGSVVSRTGSSCTFATCPLPNISIPVGDAKLSFAIPKGFTTAQLPDAASVASYEMSTASSTENNSIVIRRFAMTASSTALATIQQTAISGASGAPVSVTSFTSTVLGDHRFTVISIERFEGVIDTAYYLARGTDVVRFDAIDRGTDWTNPNLDVSALPAHTGLTKLLSTLQML